MTPNPRETKNPEKPSSNPIASPESSRSATNAMPDGTGSYPPTFTAVQNRTLRPRRSLSFHAIQNMNNGLRLPPPSPGYTGYPKPRRVTREEFMASTMGRRPPHIFYSDPRCPKVPETPQFVDGCELIRQERENIYDLRSSLPSEEVRNREWRKSNTLRAEERNQVLSAFRKRKKGGKP